ncbi:MAG: YncE family protein [Myxococcota bacterium]
MGFSSWLSIAIPLLAAFGCGLGDHGNTSQTAGGGGGSNPDAPAGFEDVDDATVVAGAAALPAALGDAFCSTDSLAGVSESGSRGIDFESGDMIPLCSGWVIIADQTNRRIEVRNIVTGDVDSRYDVPGVPDDLELDVDAKRVYVTLPAQNLIASIDLLGTDDRIAATNSAPTSITQTGAEILVAADEGDELRVYQKSTLALLSLSEDLDGEAIVFNPEDNELVAASSSDISVFDYTIPGGAVALSLISSDPASGDPLALEISPNYERVALVNSGGNASFAGPNVINDYESATVDGTFGAWKVEASPTAAGFSPLNLSDDSDYLFAGTATDLVIFDTARHAEISRSVPSTGCDGGEFDKATFSRGGQLALAKKNCGSEGGTEFHWMAPAGGFGDSASTIGVDVPGLAAVLPTLEADPLCSSDDLSGITSSSDGSLTIPRAGDIEPLCDGWIFVAERATNRVRLMNAISGATLSEWDLPDLPVELVIDEVNKYLFVAMPSGGGVSRIDLAGPNVGDLATAAVGGFPTSLSVGNGDTIWALGHFEPGGEIRITALDGPSMTFGASIGLEEDFESATSQLAYDRTTDQLFVSDSAGFARFTLNGGNFDLSDPGEELFDSLDSEIILDSPDNMSIALVDQNSNLVYDFDSGVIADLTDTFWEVDSENPITAIAFSSPASPSSFFGVATTDELIVFNAEGNHAEVDRFAPNNCLGDTESRAAISRGGEVAFFKSDCNEATESTQTIYWNEF